MDAERKAYALDSFALPAYFGGESGGPRVKELFRGAQAGDHDLYLSLINMGEVLYITERETSFLAAQRVLAAIDQLSLHVVPCSRATVLAAAHFKARYRISDADAFAIVAARDTGCVLVTGDPEFRRVADDNVIALEWLR